MPAFLILYSTTDGHTLEICRRLAELLEQRAHQAVLVPIGDAGDLDLGCYDRVVIGASIRYGRHSPLVLDFINRHAEVLEAKHGAFFSVNLVARKPAKSQPDTNPYVKRFLRRIVWKPGIVEVFAGKLDYPRYSLTDRFIIRLIMWITGGPTDPGTVVDFTDWRQVETFAARLADDGPERTPGS
jgi:menaquinone-dependent protoporphyrinogen oxidase